MYKSLTGYSPSQSEAVLNLLRGFSIQDLRQPDVCEALIQHLADDKLSIRELARGNLYLLVPQGQTIAFDAAGDAGQRQTAQTAWRKLLPLREIP